MLAPKVKQTRTLNSDLTAERVLATRAKRKRDEIAYGKESGKLCEKEVILKQAAFIFITFRQAALLAPNLYARSFLNITDVKVARRRIREMMVTLLKDLKDFPARVVDPNWLDEIDDEQTR